MRHGSAQPKVTMDFEHARAAYTGLIPTLSVAYTEAMRDNYEEWITKWPALKQAMLRKSSDMDLIRPGRVDFMVKRECNHALPSKARGIQMYINLATQARFGPEFYCLQKAVGKVFMRKRLPGGVRVTFASGMNSVTLGEWMSNVLLDYDTPMFYERDGKNWDSTMQMHHHLLKTTLYEVAGTSFVEFVDACFRVRGVGRFGGSRFEDNRLEYTLVGTVKSGHNDTTLGNSIVNAGIAYEVMRRMGLRGDIIVAGDDLLCVIDGDFDADEFARLERELGIIPEYRKFSSYQDVSFISGLWVRSAHATLVFVPKPGRLLARLFWTCSPPTPALTPSFIHSVVSGLLPTCSGLPVVGAFLRAHDVEAELMVLGRDFSATNPHIGYDREVIRDAFVARYGLTYDEIDRLELKYSSRVDGPRLVVDLGLEKIMAVDLAELHDRPLAGFYV
jgi:hypothetical protein